MFNNSSSQVHIVLEVFRFTLAFLLGYSVTEAGVVCSSFGGWLAAGVSGGTLAGVFSLSGVTASTGFCSRGLDRGWLFRSALFH